MKLYLIETMLNPDASDEEILGANEEHKVQRINELTQILRVKLEPYLIGEIELFHSGLDAGLEEKLEHPFGSDILKVVAYVYSEVGKKHMGRLFGVESFFTGIGETFHNISSGYSLIKSGMSLVKIVQELEEGTENGTGPSEESHKRFFDAAMYTLWKIGKLEIEEILRRVCSQYLDTEDPQVKKQRARALFEAGKYYKAQLGNIQKTAFSDKINDMQTNFGAQ
eukprot:TRINITY_DN3348_c0_g1_i2.p1 TRINITY_DN3348_c0_g1~~TRINITY_DN3348_c0_g1_i2.p1  ORF type:complete len:224 (-),score=52.99 TRINITY_DN3348_c0_g1_i2:6-677(-)